VRTPAPLPSKYHRLDGMRLITAAGRGPHTRHPYPKRRLRPPRTWNTPMVTQCAATGSITAALMRQGGGRCALRRRQGGVADMKPARTVAKNRSAVMGGGGGGFKGRGAAGLGRSGGRRDCAAS
jgi:hypothetical protein